MADLVGKGISWNYYFFAFCFKFSKSLSTQTTCSPNQKHTRTHTHTSTCSTLCCHCPRCPGVCHSDGFPASPDSLGTHRHLLPPPLHVLSPPPGGRCRAILHRARRGRHCPLRRSGEARQAPREASSCAGRRGCRRTRHRRTTRTRLPGWKRLNQKNKWKWISLHTQTIQYITHLMFSNTVNSSNFPWS